MSELTEAGFAQRCAYIATKAAKWAGDSLTLPENYGRPTKPETVARFTAEIRDMLDHLDEQAGAPSASPAGEVVTYASNEDMLRAFGQDNFRRGSRADYVTASDWEDYVEVPEHVLERIRSTLYAAPREDAEGLAEALVWNPYRASTPFGNYHVTDGPMQHGGFGAWFEGKAVGLNYDSVEAAKDACKRDYESRLRGALARRGDQA